jgi:hypothetical protein
MPQSILVFDFGSNEEAAQQARHKFEGWKQAFRLGDKAVLKFERKLSETNADEASAKAGGDENAREKPQKSAKSKGTGGAAAKKGARKKSSGAEPEKSAEQPPASANVRILIRLSFSDHEKLSFQRWLDRIPAEEPFKSAKGETIRHSDASFGQTSDLFDALD